LHSENIGAGRYAWPFFHPKRPLGGNLDMNDDLFRTTALSSTEDFMPLGKIVPSVLPAPNPAISGLVAKLPDVCKKRGSHLAIIGPAPVPHRASLHCKECRTFRGWVSDTSFKFVSKVVEQWQAD
jgi:hypothetical protein